MGVLVCIIQISGSFQIYFSYLKHKSHLLSQLYLNMFLFFCIWKITPINLHLIKHENDHTINSSLWHLGFLHSSICSHRSIRQEAMVGNLILIFRTQTNVENSKGPFKWLKEHHSTWQVKIFIQPFWTRVPPITNQVDNLPING